MDLIEKLLEFEHASGSPPDKGRHAISVESESFLRMQLIAEEATEWYLADTLAEQAKEVTDILYVTIGTMARMGLSWADVLDLFNIVHDANMSKFRGGVQVNEAGKVMKSASYISPEEKIRIWADIVQEQDASA